MPRYLPRRDADALAWLTNFSQHLSAAPGAYGVAAADAANIAQRVDAYAAAYEAAGNLSTRNAGTILLKDQTRAVAVDLARAFTGLIKANQGVSDEAKIAAGVPLPNPHRAPVPPPTSSPALSIVGATPGAQTLTYRDSFDSARRAKPYGVKALQLFVAIGEAPARDASAARFQGQYGRNPIGVAFGHEADGRVATYFARWISTRNDEGPWSNPQSMRIAA